MRYRPAPLLQLIRRFARSVEYYGFLAALKRSYQRLFRSLRNHGFSGTFERAFIKAPPPPTISDTEQPHPFDLLFGTDTGGYFAGDQLASVSLAALSITAYLGVPPSTFRPALVSLPIKFEEYSFVDIGCGKGRALLIAAEFPLRHLFGIEIADELCKIAKANVACKPDWEQRITILNEDATAFTYPDGPLLVYLYRPFYNSILRRVIANLERQLRRAPRPTYLLYVDLHNGDFSTVYQFPPRCRKVMQSFSLIHELSDTAYQISDEEAPAEPSAARLNRYTLYSACVTI